MMNADIDLILQDVAEAEHLDLLFAAFAECLDQEQINHGQIKEALHILDYLHTGLRSDHPSQFNLAFRRFYKALQRLIIDANRDGSPQKLTEARRAIVKLTGPDYGFEFLRNCVDESLFSRDELTQTLVMFIGPQLLAHSQPDHFKLH